MSMHFEITLQIYVCFRRSQSELGTAFSRRLRLNCLAVLSPMWPLAHVIAVAKLSIASVVFTWFPNSTSLLSSLSEWKQNTKFLGKKNYFQRVLDSSILDLVHLHWSINLRAANISLLRFPSHDSKLAFEKKQHRLK